MRNFVILLLLTTCFATGLRAQDRQDKNVILITFDGLRWQEVFSGADSTLFFRDGEAADGYWAASAEARREKLMPFFWETIAKQGALFGNRKTNSSVSVTNKRVFSYPSYNEILTGFADNSIDSNDKIPNRNTTVLEWVDKQPGFKGRVAAYTSWDVFPFIINEERAGITVNSGFEASQGSLSGAESLLNRMQVEIITPWEWERYDVFTHYLAREYLKREQPRLFYIGYGDTDEFAHSDDYGSYLRAAHQIDQFIRDIWEWVQSNENYRNNTTLVITTDHGRGFKDRWVGHGIDWVGSEAIWLAAIGPKVPALGEATDAPPVFQNQIASTIARILGLEYTNDPEVGAPIEAILGLDRD